MGARVGAKGDDLSPRPHAVAVCRVYAGPTGCYVLDCRPKPRYGTGWEHEDKGQRPGAGCSERYDTI